MTPATGLIVNRTQQAGIDEHFGPPGNAKALIDGSATTSN